MAQAYPESFPREPNADDPEYEVFQTLRLLPDAFSVFYSKKFKGGRWSKEECEIDFIVFDGKFNLLCIEVKGGAIEYDGVGDQWLQNGVPLKVSPDRQVSASTHSLIEFLGETVKDVNVGWCVCFPNCSMPNNLAPPSGLPKAIIIDENGLLEPEKAIGLVNEYLESCYKRIGCNSRTGEELVNRLTLGIGFVQKDRNTVIQNLQKLLSHCRLRKRYPAYESFNGVVFRCSPAIHDRLAASENLHELSVSTGIPVEADVVGGITFWCWEEVWKNTWDVCCLGETGDDGCLYFPLEGFEYGEAFHLNATLAVNGRHHITMPDSYGQPLEIERDGGEFYEVSGLVDDCQTIPRGADDRHYLRLAGGGDFAREQLPAEWFALAAAGDDETHWHDFNDGTGKITSQIGQVGNNWIIRTTIRNHILSVPRLARVTVSDSKGQWIAQGFIGLYDLKKDNRSAGQLAINVVAPIFESAGDDKDKVGGYYYAVEPWRIEDLKAADRETVKLSLAATDHSLSREVLEKVLKQLPSDDLE